MTKHIPSTELSMLETLHGIASDHANGGDPRLVLLDLDPEKYPGQRLDQVVIRSGPKGPLPVEVASMVANDIEPRYPALENLFAQKHRHTSGIQRIIEQIRSNNNVINASDHKELMDIAFSHLALTGVIKRAGIQVRSGIVLSKMTDFLGYQKDDSSDITPLRDLLALGFDKCFLTIPRTTSTEGKFNDAELAEFNKQPRKRIKTTLRRNSLINKRQAPFFLGMAIPGKRNVAVTMPDGSVKILVGSVSDGILSFTSIENTEAVATSIRMDSEDPKAFIDDLPMRLETSDDISILMGRLLVGLHQLDGEDYIYEDKRNS